MKRLLLFLALHLALVISPVLSAQPPGKHRVVIDITTVISDGWAISLTNAEALLKAFGPRNVEIEIVAHGAAVSMLKKNDNEFQARITKLADSGVRFVTSGKTLNASRIGRNDLLPFVTIVESGVAEIIIKQEAGWSYLKGGL